MEDNLKINKNMEDDLEKNWKTTSKNNGKQPKKKTDLKNWKTTLTKIGRRPQVQFKKINLNWL